MRVGLALIPMAVVKNRFVRFIIFSTGFISLVVGTIGIFVPLLPTTPFVLLSAWCFLKSSNKAHEWLYTQPLLGKSLQQWEENKVISKKSKAVALITIAISLGVIWMRATGIEIKIILSVVLLLVSVFILTRPSH